MFDGKADAWSSRIDRLHGFWRDGSRLGRAPNAAPAQKDAAAAATSFFVALLAGIPSARRAAAVQPMVAMRAE